MGIQKAPPFAAGLRPSKSSPGGELFCRKARCLLACGSPGGKAHKESLTSQGTDCRKTLYESASVHTAAFVRRESVVI